MESNYVYFWNVGSQWKIGSSKNPLEHINIFRKTSTEPTNRIFIIRHNEKKKNKNTLEALFHEIFNKKRIKHEMFRLEDIDINWIQANYECEEIVESI